MMQESQDNTTLALAVLETQNKEIELKEKELSIREVEIESHERIALASIAASKDMDTKQGDIFLKALKSKFWLTITVIAAVSGTIITAMYFQQAEIAMEIIKLLGSVMLGYFAGFNRGKVQEIENKKQSEDRE